MLNTARQVGAALGATAVGALLQHRLTVTLTQAARERATQLPPGQRAAFLDSFAPALRHGLQLGGDQAGGYTPSPALPAALADRYRALAADAFADAFLSAVRPALGVVAGVLLAAGLLALLLRRGTVPAAAPEPDPAYTSPGEDTDRSVTAVRTAGEDTARPTRR